MADTRNLDGHWLIITLMPSPTLNQWREKGYKINGRIDNVGKEIMCVTLSQKQNSLRSKDKLRTCFRILPPTILLPCPGLKNCWLTFPSATAQWGETVNRAGLWQYYHRLREPPGAQGNSSERLASSAWKTFQAKWSTQWTTSVTSQSIQVGQEKDATWATALAII